MRFIREKFTGFTITTNEYTGYDKSKTYFWNKNVRSITTGAKYTDNPPVQIVFRTIEETEMTCVIKSGREPAKDLCDWILQS